MSGATKVSRQPEETMPESTREHFNRGTLAILNNVKIFCGLAAMVNGKEQLVTLGRSIMEIINGTLEGIEAEQRQDEKKFVN